MDKFENVTAIKKANIYFDGKVSSRTLIFADGSKKTLGIILPGEYTFSTADKEVMEVLAGSITARLPGSDNWVSYCAGESFTVPANAKFYMQVEKPTDYCCSYIKD